MTVVNTGPDVSGADFPIVWDDPAQAQASWFQDVMHNPLPITPLSATMYQPAFAEGASRAIARLMLPIVAINKSVQNGFVYLSPEPFSTDPSALEARLAEAQRVTMELAPTILRDWRETFEPDVLARAEALLALDADGKPAAEIARFVVGAREQLVDVWDIHMRVNIPIMNAVFALEDVVASALGDEAVGESRQLLQGFENKSLETGRALWDLSRWIRADQVLCGAVLGARVRDGALEVEATPRMPEFVQRWREFLDVYGWRSDRFMELGHRSWHEDPSTPLTPLKGYLAKDDAAEPFAAQAAHAGARDRAAAALEARMPEDMRPMFRGLLAVSQQYLPVAEDHNFTIDQKFTAVVRHTVLKLGDALVAAGALPDREDVFYLTFEEVCALVDDGAADGLADSVRQRRRELIRQMSLQAPPMIGAPPPPDEPLPPLVSKFFGIGIVPSSDAGVVTGHPCSRGVVTGIAKVVPTLADAGKLQPGDVMVCRNTMPAWTPLFGVAGAIVADSGGPLSHCAIVAREYGIPCVAGTVNGTAVLKDGMRLRVDGGTGVVTVLNDRTRG